MRLPHEIQSELERLQTERNILREKKSNARKIVDEDIKRETINDLAQEIHYINGQIETLNWIITPSNL